MIERAQILIEALPYIQRFHGKTVVIKYGGHAMLSPELRESFVQDVVLLESVGINPVIVHGGGPQITELIGKLGLKAHFRRGMRGIAAGEIAGALRAEKLILLTDVEGVQDEDGKLISILESARARRLIARGAIGEGMIPKVECCIDALRKGVAATHIIDGRVRHALLLEIFTREGVGTEVVQRAARVTDLKRPPRRMRT